MTAVLRQAVEAARPRRAPHRARHGPSRLVYRGYLAFNVVGHRDQNDNSAASPVELDEITRDIASMLNRSKRKLRKVQ